MLAHHPRLAIPNPQDNCTVNATPGTATLLPPSLVQGTFHQDPLVINLATLGSKNPPPVNHHVGLTTSACTGAPKNGAEGEMAILFCWQFVLLFVLPVLVAFCQFVWGRTFWQMN